MRGMSWIEALERQAGHIIVGVLLLLIGAALWRLGVPKAEDILPFALGVIARSMVAAEEGRNGKAD
jgi:hypothetical protein